jgi:hypothetical protein
MGPWRPLECGFDEVVEGGKAALDDARACIAGSS